MTTNQPACRQAPVVAVPPDAQQAITSDGLRYSAGVGFSWISPLGPLRFAIAEPLRKRPGDRIQRLQFQIGTSF